MILKILFFLFLIAIGAYAIWNEEKFIKLERKAFQWIKEKLFRSSNMTVVLPSESDAQKQARFNSGVQAANELYEK